MEENKGDLRRNGEDKFGKDWDRMGCERGKLEGKGMK